MRLASFLSLVAASGLIAAEGYTDTPFIPGTQWRVHDSARPQPPRAEASKLKCNEAAAPAGAIVLVWSVVGTLLLAKLVSVVCGGLRVSEEVETIGLDLTEHGEEGYHG